MPKKSSQNPVFLVTISNTLTPSFLWIGLVSGDLRTHLMRYQVGSPVKIQYELIVRCPFGRKHAHGLLMQIDDQLNAASGVQRVRDRARWYVWNAALHEQLATWIAFALEQRVIVEAGAETAYWVSWRNDVVTEAPTPPPKKTQSVAPTPPPAPPRPPTPRVVPFGDDTTPDGPPSSKRPVGRSSKSTTPLPD